MSLLTREKEIIRLRWCCLKQNEEIIVSLYAGIENPKCPPKNINGEWSFVVTYNSNIETCTGHVKAAQKKKSLVKNGS